MKEMISDQTRSVFGRSLLVVAHPGHELRIHGWMERTSPVVIVITDGSGSAGTSRLECTKEILNQTDSTAGPLFGAYRDRELYAALLKQDHDPFLHIVNSVASCILENEIETIVADAADAYNPMHDICRLIVNCAVAQVKEKMRKSYSFPLVGSPRMKENNQGEIMLDLNEKEFYRKQEAAKKYAPLDKDIAAALKSYSWDNFRHEYLYMDCKFSPPRSKPYYEIYGEAQVASGRYESVLRYEQHVRPLAEVLKKAVISCEF